MNISSCLHYKSALMKNWPLMSVRLFSSFVDPNIQKFQQPTNSCSFTDVVFFINPTQKLSWPLDLLLLKNLRWWVASTWTNLFPFSRLMTNNSSWVNAGVFSGVKCSSFSKYLSSHMNCNNQFPEIKYWAKLNWK